MTADPLTVTLLALGVILVLVYQDRLWRRRYLTRGFVIDSLQAQLSNRDDVAASHRQTIRDCKAEVSDWRALADQFRVEADRWRSLVDLTVGGDDHDSAGMYPSDAPTIPSIQVRVRERAPNETPNNTPNEE